MGFGYRQVGFVGGEGRARRVGGYWCHLEFETVVYAPFVVDDAAPAGVDEYQGGDGGALDGDRSSAWFFHIDGLFG